MKRFSTIFLQIIIIALGLGVLAFLLWEPTVEGVNANATSLYEIYFDDPFLLYAYSASIFFFIACYQTFLLGSYIRRNEMFSQPAVKALRYLKYCSTAIALATAAPVAYLFIVRPEDDIAGGVAMGLFVIFISTVVATNASIHEKIWQKAIDIQSENDLTV